MKNKDRFITILLTLMVLSFGCTSDRADRSKPDNNDHLINAVLYHQTAAEYRALCYQAFNLGRMMLNEEFKDTAIVKPRAVVVDIDETLLANTPYEAKCIKENINYPEGWKEWMESSRCKALPGAVEFLNYADSLGFTIMYVTNRKQEFLAASIRNLKNEGFPAVDENHLFMRAGDSSSKEERRQKIIKKYHVSLFVGDDIQDFSAVFENKSVAERFALTDSLRAEFGRKFLVLPNPIYGSWDKTLFHNYKDQEILNKNKIRTEHLDNF